MDFAAVTGFQKSDFRTIGLFRRRHLQALAGLFQQVLVICRRAGLVTLGHVALDGTKVKANASKHKAMSYDRMVKAEKKDDDEHPPEPPVVDPKAQRKFTDPESRIMPTKNGFEQCFNAQATVRLR